MDCPVDKLALVSQHIMNACKDNYGTAVLATTLPHSCNKMECFNYKGERVINAKQCTSKKFSLQLYSNNFGLKQLCTTVMKFH